MPHKDPEQAREYRREYTKRPYVRDKAREGERRRSRDLKDWINNYKVERGCVDCGYRESPYALDFDHMDGKTRNVANLKSIGAVLREVEKHGCVIRCANCHRIKSWQTKTWVVDT